MNMDHTDPRIERLNYIATGLMVSGAVHALLCLVSVPASLRFSHDGGALLVLWGSLKALWNLTGIPGGIGVAWLSFFMFNARSYEWSRRIPLAACVLPFFGSVGLATAFALIPLAAAAHWHLKNPLWSSVFMDGPAVEFIPEQEEAAPEAELPTSYEEEEELVGAGHHSDER